MVSRFLATAILLGSLQAAAAVAAERPVVVELFTSEGCSSCPPADEFLSELSRGRRDVLPLAFHVTYWDRLGWKDPFSLSAATQRQSVYGSRFGGGSYTPEMVVDGRKGVVGSERDEAEAALASAKQEADGAPVSLQRGGGSVSIKVGGGSGTGRVVLVGFDHQHRTAVGRGENSGRTLTESNIVRSIRPVGEWTGAPLSLDVGAPEGEDAAVLVEAPDGHIVGAARLGSSS